MTGKRKRYSAGFKAKLTLEALRGGLTVAQRAAKHGIHQTMMGEWKRQAVEPVALMFSSAEQAHEMAKVAKAEVERPRARIAELVVERDFLEDFRSMSIERRRRMIEPEQKQLSIARQCELVSISRSGFYRRPTSETALNLELMRLIDAQSLQTP